MFRALGALHEKHENFHAQIFYVYGSRDITKIGELRVGEIPSPRVLASCVSLC